MAKGKRSTRVPPQQATLIARTSRKVSKSPIEQSRKRIRWNSSNSSSRCPFPHAEHR